MTSRHSWELREATQDFPVQKIPVDNLVLWKCWMNRWWGRILKFQRMFQTLTGVKIIFFRIIFSQ
jgi:hypothetical protein